MTATSTIRLGIAGAAGRMGRALIQAAAQTSDLKIVAATEHPGAASIGQDAGELAGAGRLGATIGADLGAADFDVLVDFTRPEVTLAHIEACQRRGRRIVIGTTGIDAAGRARIEAAGKSIAIVYAPNMSVGVNLCFHLTDIAARVLGQDADVEITEAHHRHKRDAPSGTALRLGEVVASAWGRNLSGIAVYDRHDVTAERPRGAIGFASVRAGEIVGDHTVLFALPGERVELTHRAESRLNFAEGALRAARWLMSRPAGLYDMQDVLGLRGLDRPV